jgi:pimeloyl-ACP methyl ester carboxylesterase
VLPPETLAWRLQLLQQGSSWLTPRLKDIQQRVLVLAGDQDLLIPSKDEAQRLGKVLPRARTRVLPNRSHALLQEAGVDLYQLLEVGAAGWQPAAAAAAVAALLTVWHVDVCASAAAVVLP